MSFIIVKKDEKMKLTLLTTAALLGISVSPALAGNLDEPLVPQSPIPMAPPIMVNTGGDWTGFYAGGSLGYADASDDTAAFDADGVTYGLHGGYDYDVGTVVIGAELEISGFDVVDGANSIDTVTRAKLRAAYDAGAFMPYVTAGIADLDVDGLNLSDTGAVYGLGMDYKYSDDPYRWRSPPARIR